MWPIKWTPGAAKNTKRKVDVGDRDVEKDGEKEKKSLKRERKFHNKWLNEWKWLQFDGDISLMFCKTCIAYDESGKGRAKYPINFVKGSNNFRTSALVDHENSTFHKDAADFENARANPQETPARKSLLALNEHKRKTLEHYFRNIHGIIKSNRPISDFVWVNKLDIAKGILDSGETYNNCKAATCFLENIAEVERESILESVKRAKFFSLTMDGSTDEATVEQETLFVRFCCQGDTVTKFLTIGEPASTSSADLYTFVTNILKTHELNQNISFIGFGCDGAANMMGKKGGLVTLLQKDFPELLACHCLAHRLELSFRDVVKADKKYERLSTLLLGIFYFYKRSPKQRKNLRHTFEVMNVKGTLPHRVSGSRWMPHMQRALKSLFTSFPGYVSHLQNESHTNSKAEGLVKIMCNYQVIVYATVLLDVLNPLVRLSLFLQSRDVTLADVHLMVRSTVSHLESLKEKKSEALLKLEETKEVAGMPLTATGPFNSGSLINKMVTDMTKAISIRFADLWDEVKFTEIANLRNWPLEELKDYGCDHLDVAMDRFKNTLIQQGVHLDELQDQWTLLKTLVHKKYGNKLTTAKWTQLWSSFSDMGIQDILTLMDLLRTLPATSVANEASFNQMKLTKTNRRQRLSNMHLNDCMVIQLESADILDFDPTSAVNKWMTSSKQPRRLNYARSKKQQDTDKSSVQEETDVIVQEETDVIVQEETEGQGIVQEETDDNDYESDTLESESDIEQSEELNNYLMNETVLEIEREFE